MGSFTAELMFPLGDDDSGLDFTTPTTADHVQAAIDRLAYQFQDKPNIIDLITELCNQVNALEIVYGSQLPTLPQIDISVGVQLDAIGALLGERRGGFDDTVYRIHLKARIYLNRSSGNPKDIYALFAALLSISSGLWIEEHPPAGFTLHVTGTSMDATLAGYLKGILTRAKAAGVDARLNWNTVPGTEAFCFAGGPGLGFGAGIWSTTE